MLGTALSVSDSAGHPVTLEPETTEILLETRRPGEHWRTANDARANFQGPWRLDVVLVADNSGSQDGNLEQIRESLDGFARLLLTRQQSDRVGLVRVSTVADIYQELTEDSAEFERATGDLFVTNGWTALWDGVRVANEMLATAVPIVERNGSSFEACLDRSQRAIVAFTDGKENNSADQHETSYEGDGVDTSFDDLTELHVYGAKTPVHWVGVGDKVDEAELSAMADGTGARYVPIDQFRQLHGALVSTAARLTHQVPVCFDLNQCGSSELRITVTYESEGETRVLFLPHWLNIDCECEKNGKVGACTLTEVGSAWQELSAP